MAKRFTLEQIRHYMDYCVRIGMTHEKYFGKNPVSHVQILQDEQEIKREIEDAESIPTELRENTLLRSFLRRIKGLIAPESLKETTEWVEVQNCI